MLTLDHIEGKENCKDLSPQRMNGISIAVLFQSGSKTYFKERRAFSCVEFIKTLTDSRNFDNQSYVSGK